MFDYPETKRICRADLRDEDDDGDASADGSSAPSEEKLNSLFKARLEARFGSLNGGELQVETQRRAVAPAEGKLDVGNNRAASPSRDNVDTSRHDEQESFEFSLFNVAGSAPKISLKDGALEGEAFTPQKRPLDHYMARTLAPAELEQIHFAAVSADEIISRSKQRLWGMELPWRVTTIAVTRKGTGMGEQANLQGSSSDKENTARKRPGKKQRIAARTKARARENQKKILQVKLAEKEEHVKDKKKRMNRAKKLRRRAKAREQKGLGLGADADDDRSGSDDG